MTVFEYVCEMRITITTKKQHSMIVDFGWCPQNKQSFSEASHSWLCLVQ